MSESSDDSECSSCDPLEAWYLDVDFDDVRLAFDNFRHELPKAERRTTPTSVLWPRFREWYKDGWGYYPDEDAERAELERLKK